MNPIIIDATPGDLADFGWDAEAQERPDQYHRPLLSCGHYDRPHFECSSQWDFPDDVHVCPTCGEERQWDVQVQAFIHDSWAQS